MIVDSSVIVAIIRGEPEAPHFAAALESSGAALRMSAANFFEASIVIDGSRDPVLSRRLDEVIFHAAIAIEPVTERQARIAREAYRDFGKGSGHAAGLNIGDCFAYALAKDLDEPLLFKGRGFAETDMRRVEK